MKIKPEISMNEETLMHITDLSKGDCFIFKHSKESGWTNMIPYFDEQRNQKTLIVNQGDVFMVTKTNTFSRAVEIIKLNDYSKIEMYDCHAAGMFNIFQYTYVKRVKLMDDGVDPSGLFKLFKKCNMSDVYVGDAFVAVPPEDDNDINWFICIDDGGLHAEQEHPDSTRIVQYVDPLLHIHETPVGGKIHDKKVIKLLGSPDIKIPFKF